MSRTPASCAPGHRVVATRRSAADSARYVASRNTGGLAAAVVLAIGLAASNVSADNAAATSRRGVSLAKSGNCVAAVPLLEEAELSAHRPVAALALGDCYVALGELIKAAETYRALADEKPTRRHSFADRIAIRNARSRLNKVEQRIPTLSFELPEPYEDLEIFVDGHKIDDPSKPRPVEANVSLQIVARAKGKAELQETVQLEEGERVVRPLRMAAAAPPKSRRPRASGPSSQAAAGPGQSWLGLRFRGYLVPRAVMELFGDGGRTVFLPGGALVYSLGFRSPEVHLSLGYTNYQLQPMPFKAKGAPDTDYEIIDSTLEAGYATVEVTWMEPLDAKENWQFRYGFGVGLGWMFRGELYRTQAYPANYVAGDPYSYRKCDGPNNPAGSWRYCNALDWDSDHYNYAEPTWVEGGRRPPIYPWLALPLLGLSAKIGDDLAFDL